MLFLVPLTLDAHEGGTHIRCEVDESFPESVAALKAELKRLESELRLADAEGDRRRALNTLARMLHIQKVFMRQWSRQRDGGVVPGMPPGNDGSDTPR